MNNRLILVGAGGHGKVVADIAMKCGYTEILFADDRTLDTCMGFPVIGPVSGIPRWNDGKTDFVISIGNNAARKKIAECYDVNWVTLIHPSAQIGVGATIGKGTVVMACAAVNACASIGDHCIINTGAVVEHDNVLENYVHISPNAALGGTVFIGEETHIGIGATVINNVSVCANCTVGAGAVVTKNIPESGTYIGVPARKR